MSTRVARNSSTSKPNGRKTAPRKKAKVELESEDSADAFQDDGDASEPSDPESLDSDALDEDSDAEVATKKRKRGAATPAKSKAKRAPSSSTKSPKKKTASSRKKKKKADGSADEDDDFELQEGQEIVGRVVQAPKTGHVPPGQVSQNTFDFLTQLTKPECNDREWFKLHEPVYRLAENEWKAFTEVWLDRLIEVDNQIPHLPPKDVVVRIYRDVRFSNDKTPYKTNFAATTSRSGRKGIFAHYFVMIQPGNKSLIAAGTWCPGKNELSTIRSNLQRSSRRLRSILSAPEFVGLFGPAKPHPKGQQQSIFGRDDELKTAPKGIAKDHPDIDLLKCRSFSIHHYFTDKQVLQPTFQDELAHVAGVMRPFVHHLNDLMTIQGGGDDSDSGDEDEADEGPEED